MKKRLLLGLLGLVAYVTAWAGWRGDINGDSKVDVSDVNIMIDMVLGKQSPDLITADLDNNGIIDVSDVNILIDIVLGKTPLIDDGIHTITVNGVSFAMVDVKGGTFNMGATAEQGSDPENDEKPAHQVKLSDFSIGQTEVTQELWQAVMGSNPSNFTGNMQRPVEKISWNDCQEFIAKLNQLTGMHFRLPTEAEWEYAARGGEYSKGYKHAGSNNIDEVAWYKENSNSLTHPVAQKQPNELGLYDMNGNVFEWCLDWYNYNYYSASPSANPVCLTAANNRVCRGGSLSFSEKANRVSYRYNHRPYETENYIGLRLVLSPLEFYMANDVPFTMVHVEGGIFTMGATPEQGSDAQEDEYPTHQVTLTDFSIGQTEVTQALWIAVMGSNPSEFTGNLNRPVEKVSYNDCKTFIKKLNNLTGKHFRLPTEAEWEYAARGGNKSKGYKYAGSNTLGYVAWYLYNVVPDRNTRAVGTKAPNELGLYDMSGNVKEWCQDLYGSYSSEAQFNPTGASEGMRYVFRGGSWEGTDCRVSVRGMGHNNFTDHNLGLRLVLDESEDYQVNGVTFTMVNVAGGTFTMGARDNDSEAKDNEKPAHQVTLSDFSIGQTEVTQALWVAVMGENPSFFLGNLQRPVEGVSWEDCQEFITKLNELTGETFRLPTEAEWEYAARGGSRSKGYKYAGSNTLDDVAWYTENSLFVEYEGPDYGTHSVGTKMANELGLFDMTGNVWEWCHDWFGAYSEGAQTNPRGPSSGYYRVWRGASWNYGAGYCRLSQREKYSPDESSHVIGLRLAK